MFSSTIIATIGRPTLHRAVESVLSQAPIPAGVEVIVVNDSGVPLGAPNWRDRSNVKVVNTSRRERSIARNTGAATARGRYLHFLDDDDWLAPGALQAIWELANNQSAPWLYGSTQLVDREGKELIRLEHNLAGNCFMHFLSGEWIPLQSSWISADTFFRAGGFNPKLAGPEDIDLLRRIALRGDVQGTPKLVSIVARGEIGSSTDRQQSLVTARWAREIVLEHQQAFQRMRNSANSHFLRGRMVRAYGTSLIWNLLRMRVFKCLSRGLQTAASLMFSVPSLRSLDFWRALGSPYQSPTFRRGFEARER